MDFVLEICLIGFIIYLVYKLYFFKKKYINAISFFEDKLTRKELEFNLAIDKLQSSFAQEQYFLKERQTELNLKEIELLSNISDLENRLQ